MTCGIYKLNFDSEHFYIGKSINIEERYKQHYRSFVNNSAAKNMQDCFDISGYPEAEILITCHPDHLDVLEPLFIHTYYNSAYCLNSDIPTVHHNVEWTLTSKVEELLKMSTFSHINEIIDLKNKCTKLIIEHEIAERAERDTHRKELAYIRNLPEVIEYLEKADYFNIQAQEIREQASFIEHLKTQYLIEKNKSWWTKLWE